METSQRVAYQELTLFVRSIFESLGVDNAQTQTFGESLIWSDLIGRPTHGVWRLPSYVKRVEEGLIKCPCEPKVDTAKSAISLMDGDAGLGHYVGHKAMSLAMDKAREFGVGAVGVHNSNHFGTGAYYVQLAAQENMLGFAYSNSIAKVAPHGGVKPLFGTNPFAFGAPGRDGEHMMLDMATTAMAGSQVMKYAEQGKDLPEGVAIDSNGNPIVDPAEVNKGVLLPFGGAKGYGLSLMIEIMVSVMTGAALSTDVNSMFTNFEDSGLNGHFFMAIDIAHVTEPESFKDRLERLFSLVRAGGLDQGDVLIPGELRWQSYKHNLVNGVPLDGVTSGALSELAKRHGVKNLFG